MNTLIPSTKPSRPVLMALLIVIMLTVTGPTTSAFNAGADVTETAAGAEPDVPTATLPMTNDRQVWAAEALIPNGCIFVGDDSIGAATAGAVWPTVAVSPDGATVYAASIVTCARSDTAVNILGWIVVAFHADLGLQLWFAEEPYPGATMGGVEVSPDGSLVFVTGTGWSSSYTTVAYDATSGEVVWRARHGTDGAWAGPLDIAVSPDGSRVYVTGEHRPHGSSALPPEYATLAYDAKTGEELWLSTYNGPAANQDTATSIVVSPDGARVYITGQSVGQGSHFDYATIAYDAQTGEETWIARYNGPANSVDTATAIAIDPLGARVYVTGTSLGSGTGDDYATVAYDASNGTELWVERYNGVGAGSIRDFAASLDVAPDGTTVYVTGQSKGLGTADDYATVAYDTSDGSRLWVARFNGANNGADTANSVKVSPDGSSTLVTGLSQNEEGEMSPVTISYNASTGTQRWVEPFTDPLGRGTWAPDQLFEPKKTMVLSPDGTRVYIVSDLLDSVQNKKSNLVLISYHTGMDQGGDVNAGLGTQVQTTLDQDLHPTTMAEKEQEE